MDAWVPEGRRRGRVCRCWIMLRCAASCKAADPKGRHTQSSHRAADAGSTAATCLRRCQRDVPRRATRLAACPGMAAVAVLHQTHGDKGRMLGSLSIIFLKKDHQQGQQYGMRLLDMPLPCMATDSQCHKDAPHCPQPALPHTHLHRPPGACWVVGNGIFLLLIHVPPAHVAAAGHPPQAAAAAARPPLAAGPLVLRMAAAVPAADACQGGALKTRAWAPRLHKGQAVHTTT